MKFKIQSGWDALIFLFISYKQKCRWNINDWWPLVHLLRSSVSRKKSQLVSNWLGCRRNFDASVFRKFLDRNQRAKIFTLTKSFCWKFAFILPKQLRRGSNRYQIFLSWCWYSASETLTFLLIIWHFLVAGRGPWWVRQ